VIKGEINGILFINHGLLDKSFGEVILCELSEIERTDCFSID
jgi:hypothetical protein